MGQSFSLPKTSLPGNAPSLNGATPLQESLGKDWDPLALLGTAVAEGRFVLEKLLGRGGQAAVYQIRRQKSSTASPWQADALRRTDEDRFIPRPAYTPDQAALKLFIPDPRKPSWTERFIAEYRIAARLTERPFVRAYEMFEHQNMLGFTLDLLPGGSLAQVIGNPLPPAVAVGIVLDVLEALDILHSRGIVHRDIKHSNILLSQPLASAYCTEAIDLDTTPTGDLDLAKVASAARAESRELPAKLAPALFADAEQDGFYLLPQAHLADFGISDVQDMFFGDRDFYTLTGTLQFMAPELVQRDRVDARVDLFAVGVLLFMLLAGRHPASHSIQRGHTIAALHRKMAGSEIQELLLHEVASHVPDEVTRVVMQLLEANPDRRIRTAALAFEPLFTWFCANQVEHRIRLSHTHRLLGRPYLAASTFCGRSAEQKQARELLESNLQIGSFIENLTSEFEPSAAAPSRIPASVLVIWGEGGAGKTRLTSHIRRLAEDLGYRTYSLQCKRGQGVFLDFRDVLQRLEADFTAHYYSLNPEEQAKESDPRNSHFVPDKDRDPAYALLRQVKFNSEERSSYEALHERYLLERFAALLRLHSYGQPLGVFLEDAQWLDQATLKFVFFAIRFLSASKSHGHPCQVVWVLNHRPKDLEGDSMDAVQEQLNSIQHLEQAPISIELRSFGLEEATELAASMLQLAPSNLDLRRFVEKMSAKHELTPLFVEQALWSLFSQGVLEVRSNDSYWQGQWNLDPAFVETAQLPLSVQEAIGNRASRLNAETLRILGVAAVSGKEFDLEEVARATSTDAGSVLSACEQAGREGFVQQEQEQRRWYLADSTAGVATYRFTHDRYREAILLHLEADVRKQIHSALAKAILKRWGDDEQRAPRLSAHHYGAEEYADAYIYARRVAERAFLEGQHDRAAEYYLLAFDSHSKDLGMRQESVPEEVRNQAAQSLHAVGRLQEANAQLAALLSYPNLSELLRLDIQRRLAESYFQQQQYTLAVPPMLKCLETIGIRLPTGLLQTGLAAVRGSWALLVVAPTGFCLNVGEASNPAREALVMQILMNLFECALFVDFSLALRVLNYAAVRLTREGLHPYSAGWFGFLTMILSAAGMSRLARLSEKRITQMFPHSESFAKADENLLGNKVMLPELLKQSYNSNAIGRMLAYSVRGDCIDAFAKQFAARFKEALASVAVTTDLRRRWLTMYLCASMGLYTGRINVFQALMRAALEITQTYNQTIMTEIFQNLLVGNEAVLNGQFAQAHRIFQKCRVTEKMGEHVAPIPGESQALLCAAMLESEALAETAAKAMDAARVYLDARHSNPINWEQSGALAAAALALFLEGRRKPPKELRILMRRAWVQCKMERQQRALYRAAQATLAAMQGQDRHRDRLFAEAVREAEADGLLYHLLWVLRIAKKVVPSSSALQSYYQAWHERLQENLRQAPIKLHELETGSLPPAPNSGRPDIP